MRATVSLRRGVGVLYAGVVVFVALAAFTARSIWTAWQEREGEARAAAVFDLVSERTPLRPTDARGAMAWLRLELDRFGRREHDGDRARPYASFAASGDRVPDALAPLLAAMRAALDGHAAAASNMATADGAAPSSNAARSDDAASSSTASAGAAPTRAAAATGAGPSLREQRVFELAGHPVVVTRRKGASDAERAPSDGFIAHVAWCPAAGGRAVRRVRRRPASSRRGRRGWCTRWRRSIARSRPRRCRRC